MKKEHLTDLTVFLIGSGKNPNYTDCLNALNNQTVSFKTDIIKNIHPMSKAFQEMLNRCKTKYYIQCDEDMVLNSNTIKLMYSKIIKTDSSIVMVCFKLYDSHLQYPVDGIKIYKFDIFKHYPYVDTLSCEMNQLDRLKKDNYSYIILKDIVGNHSPKWTNEGIFNRYYIFVDKFKKRNADISIVYLIDKLYSIFKNNPNDLKNFYALSGALSAFFNEKTLNADWDFTHVLPEYSKLEKIMNYPIKKNFFNVSKKKLIVQIARIPCANSGYELSNLINKYSDKYESRYILASEYVKNNRGIPYRKFPYDLFWENDKKECIEAIQKADIIHVHHDTWNEILPYLKGKKVVSTIYNLTQSLKLKYNISFNQKYIKNLKSLGTLTVADQPLQKKMFSDVSDIYLPLVKMLFDFEIKDKNYKPKKNRFNYFFKQKPNNYSSVVIGFSPTNKESIGIGSKRYNDVIKVIDKLKENYNFEFKLIMGLPYEENLKEKSKCDIIIDDVDDKYEKAHNTSIEAALFGAVPLTNYTGKWFPAIKTDLNTLESTLKEFLENPEKINKYRKKLRKWRKEVYTPEKLIRIYDDFYDTVQNNELEILKPKTSETKIDRKVQVNLQKQIAEEPKKILTDGFKEIFKLVYNTLDKNNLRCCLLKENCLDAVLNGNPKIETKVINLGVIDIKKADGLLKDIDTKNIKVYLKTYRNKVKTTNYLEKIVRVPLPVIGYLEDNFGKDWRNIK